MNEAPKGSPSLSEENPVSPSNPCGLLILLVRLFTQHGFYETAGD